jgi:hypothetical protein
MHISKWIAKIRKSARSNKSAKSPKSPKIGQVVAIVLVALIAVAGLVLAAYQATPSKGKATTAAVEPPATQSDTPAKAVSVKKQNPPHAASANAAQAPERVTITGCLEQNHDLFKLKDTEGTDAPKSRNWKTGFLTKHSATITLLDQKNRMKLGNHVGERVSVTGMMSEHDLDVRSISRVANTCD